MNQTKAMRLLFLGASASLGPAGLVTRVVMVWHLGKHPHEACCRFVCPP